MSATYRRCRHCGDTVAHDAPTQSAAAARGLPVAERGRRQPGSDDDMRNPSCAPEPVQTWRDRMNPPGTGNAPARETEQQRRDRFHAVRVANVQASWQRGRRCLLARALDPARAGWAAIEVRGKVTIP